MKFCAPMIRGHASGEQYVWVRATYGIETRGTRWTHKHHLYYFRDAKDLTLFLLRWS